VTVREMVRSFQKEIQTSDLQPDRAAELLVKMTALLGNIADEIRQADAIYAQHLLRCYEATEKANRAKILAETSPEYDRKREARDTRELVVEMIGSLKYFLRSKEDEMRLSRHM
jgi:hypothetical protein